MLEFHAGISSEVKKYCSFQVREDQDQDQRSSPLRCISFFQICFFFNDVPQLMAKLVVWIPGIPLVKGIG